ncbi:hypothetical protein OSB04_013367 [Centaurea solstitialis]|uniref:Uncharacterized protein n=1 Tax=Centaurea solstitialis TaxID=347529 RepID=A0AA38TKN9_9ASTR|nr:hypothetical protein OSB04_013367 [Centaurea solstitialis]
MSARCRGRGGPAGGATGGRERGRGGGGQQLPVSSQTTGGRGNAGPSPARRLTATSNGSPPVQGGLVVVVAVVSIGVTVLGAVFRSNLSGNIFGEAAAELFGKSDLSCDDLRSDLLQVTIVPEVPSKAKCREIMKFLTDSYRASHLGNLLLAAYDGKKSAFAAGALPFESKEFIVKMT